MSKLTEAKAIELIANSSNLDTQLVVRGYDKVNNEYQVGVEMTKFKLREEQGADIVKKIALTAVDNTLEGAQNKALLRAVTLIGLESLEV